MEQTSVMAPRLRDSVSLEPEPILSIVSVTTGHGTSLMAPSNSRKRITRPLRTRPVQRAGFETAVVSAIAGMVCPMVLLPCIFTARLLRWIGDAQPKDERDRRNPTKMQFIFLRSWNRAARFRASAGRDASGYGRLPPRCWR